MGRVPLVCLGRSVEGVGKGIDAGALVLHRIGELSRPACWPPVRVSSGAGPVVWGYGLP